MEKIKLKAICIKQPFGDLIASGEKTIEVRKWKTIYRGDLVICTSKNPKLERSGIALCIAELYDITKSVIDDSLNSKCDIDINTDYSWHLRNVRPLKYYEPIKGKLSVYNIELPLDCII